MFFYLKEINILLMWLRWLHKCLIFGWILSVIMSLSQTKDTTSPKTAFQISLNSIKHHYKGLQVIFFFHNSLIILALFSKWKLWFILFTVYYHYNWHENITEHILLEGQLYKTGWVIFGDNQSMSKCTIHIQSPSIYLFQLDLLHLLIC